MQNRYTGDIGDFAKYAFLRALIGNELRMGVVWYLNLEEEDNTDGGRVDYPLLRSCDPALYDALAELRKSQRQVKSVEGAGIFPQNTLFHSEPLPSSRGVRLSELIRAERRMAWHINAMRNVNGADLVFVDPDNGVAGTRVTAGERRANKYVLLRELGDYLNSGHSLVVYHHQSREKGGIRSQIDRRIRPLLELPAVSECYTVIFRRQSVRAFLVFAHAKHADTIRRRSALFQQTVWCQLKHFELYTPTWPLICSERRDAVSPVAP